MFTSGILPPPVSDLEVWYICVLCMFVCDKCVVYILSGMCLSIIYTFHAVCVCVCVCVWTGAHPTYIKHEYYISFFSEILITVYSCQCTGICVFVCVIVLKWIIIIESIYLFCSNFFQAYLLLAF